MTTLALPGSTVDQGPKENQAEWNIFMRRASELSIEPPKLKAHFFYSSALPIDDPLSPFPPSLAGSSGAHTRVPPRPFSDYDSVAIEEAWRCFSNDASAGHAQEPSYIQFRKSKSGLYTKDIPESPQLERGSYRGETSDKGGEDKLPGKTSVKAGDNRSLRLGGQEDGDGSLKQAREDSNEVRGRGFFRHVEVRMEKEREKRNEKKCSKPEHEGALACTRPSTASSERAVKSLSKDSRSPEEKPISPRNIRSRWSVRDVGKSLVPSRSNSRNKAENDMDSSQRSGEIRKESEEQASLSVREMEDFGAKLSDESAAALAKATSRQDTKLLQKLSEVGTGLKDLAVEVSNARLICEPTDEILLSPGNYTKSSIGHATSEEEPNSHVLLCDDSEHAIHDTTVPVTAEEVAALDTESSTPPTTSIGILQGKSEIASIALETSYGSSPSRRDTTGTPFIRVSPKPRDLGLISTASTSGQTDGLSNNLANEPRTIIKGDSVDPPITRSSRGRSESHSSDSTTWNPTARSKDLAQSKPSLDKAIDYKKVTYVPVGISRLHLVEIPALQMKPIYWSPIHEICSVLRSTWFYKDTMLPVESDVANQIEEGYIYMKPWTQTYVDEVNSCLEIGPAAEIKILFKLWPVEESHNDSRPQTSRSLKPISKGEARPTTADEVAHKKAAETASQTENKAVGTLDIKKEDEELARPYAKSSIIYANARDAQILRPGLFPSVARGWKPLGAIRKGRSIGIAVVRGFDRRAWEKLYPPKKSGAADKAHAGATASQSGVATTLDWRNMEPSRLAKEQKRPKATDLILVIHGIGQKLSERVESYHFTHAINSFRRQLNIEQVSDVVGPWLREEFGGIMVLPINWRSTMTLEDENQATGNAKGHGVYSNEYTLKDITADTIPAVRNIISDVMLDIPYYLSHHKPKMIEAVIKEANRVYRLWCRNNPGFKDYGRVHLIAHSLGSVMAIDILSKQPTKLPKQLDIEAGKVRNYMFEFDTTNLFSCGSPAGFFLLLNHASLLPRQGKDKPGFDDEPLEEGVTGKAGVYGCLAVDNIYNIMHNNDPIAYGVNATVDVIYASLLRPASLPSATSSWLQSLSSVFGGKTAIKPRNLKKVDPLTLRPSLAKLHSAVELETHDFTREELAEKKMYLLNDNGQIDFHVSSGGGPLEIQYLDMLTAHSSYWTLQDFVRFVVLEIGRRPGKDHTMLSVRAVKKAWSRKQTRSMAEF